MTEHTPGPWKARKLESGRFLVDGNLGFVCTLDQPPGPEQEANARLIAAAPDLLAAAKKLEEAELFHANCEECEGEGVPELCGECFPLFDDARCMRLAAIAKATGRPE